jgi:uncharacterized protein YyaL (SSP411 family)
MSNRLQYESSPYLLQHAQNPVDWYPWGNEAFERAREENKPVLVSIGYAACHWCHVMEHESFEDAVVADYMNAHFVNIKVDREEHPDVDHLYMDALQAMTGAGGWPLNMFVTTDRKPFYGGTYFPPKSMYGRSSWMELLQAIHMAWHEKPEEIQLQSNQMVQHLQQASLISLSPNVGQQVTDNDIATIAENIMKQADVEWGGFGAAPKFPATGTIQFLLEYHHFHKGKEHADAALKQALLSLDKMIEGGIYDQIGGGFSRYSTDKEWLAPHFEKMLYDNALLISVLSHAYVISKKEHYKTIIIDTIAFCNRELMLDNEGGFYCALDADSEGVEGKFYTWTWEQWSALLPDAHESLIDYFGVSKHGNWEETNILHIAISEDAICEKYHLAKVEWERILADSKEKLFTKRSERIRPGTDDKILLSWNALMNIALVDAGVALNDLNYIEQATTHMQWMLEAFAFDENTLGHVYKNGLKDIPAKLDDYAYLVKALTTLASAAALPDYILEANKWMQVIETHFLSEDQTFYYYSSNLQTDILVRKVELYDGATPSANAVMMENLNVMGNLMEHSAWLERSAAMMFAQLQSSLRYPTSFARWTIYIQQYNSGFKQLIICGAAANAHLSDWHKTHHPEIYALAVKEANDAVPAVKDKFKENETFLYMCEHFMCGMPAKSVATLKLK